MINLAKLPLRSRKACLSRKYWVARGIVLDTGALQGRGKWGEGRVGLYQVVCGTVLRFFQTTMTTFIEQLIEKDSISPDD